MQTPVGAGCWFAFPKMIGGGSPAAIVDFLKHLGVKWVAPRGGEGARRDNRWTAAHTKACNDASIPVYRWIFSRPGSWGGELVLAETFKAEGDAGYIIDAEVAWETNGDWRLEASRYCEALDKKLGSDYFIADAPWPYVFSHMNEKTNKGFPFAEFAARMNMRMPQSYWTEISNAGAKYHMPRIDAQWEKFHQLHPEARKPVCHIGITYGRAELQKWGSIQLPPGTITPEDIQYFDERYRGGNGQKCRSYYSGEAASAAALETLHDLMSPPVMEAGLQLGDGRGGLPIGWADRAEQAYAERLMVLPPAERDECIAHYCRNLAA
jgi:hypothetical protein